MSAASAASAVTESLLDEVEGTYIILGGGGYGSVFLGKWNGRHVAIKRLHPALMGVNKRDHPTEAFIRFTKELPTLQQLAHTSVVQVFGMVKPNSKGGSHGLVLECLPVTLKSCYEQDPQLTNSQEVSIMASVTSGLQYLHHKGILHRNLTTTNVMLVVEAGCESVPVRAIIIDAGVACVLADVDVEEMMMSLAPGAEK